MPSHLIKEFEALICAPLGTNCIEKELARIAQALMDREEHRLGVRLLAPVCEDSDAPAELHCVYADFCLRLSLDDEAERHYLLAIHLAPRRARYHMKLGRLYLVRKKLYGEALQAYRTALAINPNGLAACLPLAVIYLHQQSTVPDENEFLLWSGWKGGPEILAAALGHGLIKWGRYDTALALLSRLHKGRKLQQHRDADILLLSNLVHVLYALGDSVGAERVLGEGFSLYPDSPHLFYPYVHELARTGRFSELKTAFANNAFVRNTRCSFAPERPIWAGECAEGKTFLITEGSSKGFGDYILYSRFVRFLSEMGGRIVMLAKPPLVPILRCIPGVAAVSVPHDPLPHVDYTTTYLNVPGFVDWNWQSLRKTLPFIRPSAVARAKWKSRLPASPVLKVGICWRCDSNRWANDPFTARSCPDNLVASFCETQGVAFINLLKSNDKQVQETAISLQMTDCASDIDNFEDTAALIEIMDIVITVDTVVAHIAGALNKPTVMMLPYWLDRKWVGGPNGDEVLYPSVIIVRQDSPGDWVSCVRKAVAAFTGLVSLQSAACSSIQ